MSKLWYPYLRTGDGQWVVGPLFDDELRAGLWLFQHMAEHLVSAHRIQHNRDRWLEELTGSFLRFLRYETPHMDCPLCFVTGAVDSLAADHQLRRDSKFAVTYRSDDGRSIRSGTTAGMDFRSAMREMIRLLGDHAQTHAAPGEARSPIEATRLYTRYRCPECAFAVEVVPVAELGASA